MASISDEAGQGARKRNLISTANDNTEDNTAPSERSEVGHETPVPGPAHNTSGNASLNSPAEKTRHSSSTKTYHPPGKARYFKSRRITDKSKIEKPWLHEKRDPREKWQTIIPMAGFLIGLGLAGFLVWEGYHSVSRNLYCPIMVEDFSTGRLNESLWSTEVEVGGYG